MPRGRPFKCPYEGCGSTNTVGKGVRKTKSVCEKWLIYGFSADMKGYGTNTISQRPDG
jgi:hypothetical protein